MRKFLILNTAILMIFLLIIGLVFFISKTNCGKYINNTYVNCSEVGCGQICSIMKCKDINDKQKRLICMSYCEQGCEKGNKYSLGFN